MSLSKVNYIDHQTVITAQNLNDIQDEILRIDPSYADSKAIPENSDLNTYTTPGTYFCPNTTTAATLSNCPANAGFSLIVLLKSANYRTQFINSGTCIYVRQQSSSGWGPWYSFVGVESNVVDISSSFTNSLSSGTFSAFALYHPMTRMVTGSISLYNATAFNTSTNFASVASAYRPSSNITIPMIVTTSTGSTPYRGTIYSGGGIRQSMSGSATGVYFSFAYQV